MPGSVHDSLERMLSGKRQADHLRHSAEPHAVSKHPANSKQLFDEPHFASLPWQITLHFILHHCSAAPATLPKSVGIWCHLYVTPIKDLLFH